MKNSMKNNLTNLTSSIGITIILYIIFTCVYNLLINFIAKNNSIDISEMLKLLFTIYLSVICLVITIINFDKITSFYSKHRIINFIVVLVAFILLFNIIHIGFSEPIRYVAMNGSLLEKIILGFAAIMSEYSIEIASACLSSIIMIIKVY